MKFLFSVLLALGLSGPALAASVDFEGLPTSFEGTSFEVDGFTFNTTAPSEVRIFDDNPGTRTTYVLSCQPGDCGNPLEIIFPNATSMFSMTIVSDEGPDSSLTLSFMTASGLVVDSFSGFDYASETKDFYTIAGLDQATSVLLTPVGEPSGFGYDDIRIDATSPVPLPMPALLLLGGLGALGLARRRSNAA
ncbi:hypothetical protein [Dinoroseobacter sp. S375]|uniref:hypothetical protein n=1 Tax=Dinoroseobacter sp. S375 TaxID=3415136 RepID=UPI003C7A0D41